MSERHRPIDAIGNAVRKGDLIHLTLPQSSALFSVVDVEPASVLNGPDNQPIAVDGHIHVVCQFKIPYRPGKNLPQMIVVQQPEQERGPRMVVTADELPVMDERKQ